MGEYIMLITIYFIVGGQCSVHEVHLSGFRKKNTILNF